MLRLVSSAFLLMFGPGVSRVLAEAVERPVLLIVHTEALKPVAEQWQAHRQATGWDVQLSQAPSAADPKAARLAIRDAIRATYAAVRPIEPGAFAVLLLGDAPDPGESDGIPAWPIPQRDPLMKQTPRDDTFITDQPYQYIDDDAVPDVPLGRIPAATIDQAEAVLLKTKQFEASSNDGSLIGRDRVVYVAGEGRFGPADALLEGLFKQMVDQIVPDALDLSMTYAKASSPYCPPPSRLKQTVIDRMTEGALLFNYVGHGFERGFDSLHHLGRRYPILRVDDLGMMPLTPRDDALVPVAFLSCCSVGWFDLPGHAAGLSEALLFHPSGPTAVISGSRITHPYANTILQKDITQALLVDRAPTAGLLDLVATRSLLTIDQDDQHLDAIAAPIALAQRWQTSLKGLRKMHSALYNLLGDPSMPLALPPPAFDSLALDGRELTGRAADITEGQALISIETARTGFAHSSKMDPLTDDNDPDLERKAAINYPLSQDRVLIELTAPIHNGAFTIQLPDPLPSQAALIRVRAHGARTDGGTAHVIGAVRLATGTPTTQPASTESTAATGASD